MILRLETSTHYLATNTHFLAMCRELLSRTYRVLYKIYSVFMENNNPSILFGNSRKKLELLVEEAINSKVQNEVDVSVVRVEFHKMDQSPYHEFIVFTVEEHSPRRSRAIIVVDRYVGEEVPVEVVQEECMAENVAECVAEDPPELKYTGITRPGPDQDIDYPPENPPVLKRKCRSMPPTEVSEASTVLVSSSSIKAAGLFLRNHPSKDVITFINEPNDYLTTGRAGSYVCKKFRVQKGVFSVAELLVLAHTIHDHNRSYHLLRYQCYWFSDIIYNVTKIRCRVVKEDAPFPDKPGKFGDVQVQQSKRGTPEEVLRKHNDAWNMAKKRIDAVNFSPCLCMYHRSEV